MRSGQLAHLTGVSTDTLRHYERLGLLPLPQRTDGNYRQYPPRLSAARGTDSTGFDNRFFSLRVEEHSGRARQGRCSLPPRARIVEFEDRSGRPTNRESHLVARGIGSLVKRLGQAIAPDEVRPARTTARNCPARAGSYD